MPRGEKTKTKIMVETLTPQQEAAIIPFREKWIERILRTEKTDEEIREGIMSIYELAGLKKPKQIWIMDSMYGVQVAYNLIVNNGIDLNNIGSNIGSNIRNNIENNIRNNIESNIWNNIWSNIRSNIWSNIGSNIRNNIEN